MFGGFDLMAMLLRVPPLLLALTVHEFAHAWTAYRCGDPTAKDMGRLTLHPLAHLDPLGTLALLFAPFGWAKPVPVNPRFFRHPRRDDILVSLAGVGTNLATAIAVALLMRAVWASGLQPFATRAGMVAWSMAYILCNMSVGLTLFNLIPLPPLDGSHVFKHLLSYQAAAQYERFAPFASMLFLILIVSGMAGYVLGWPLTRTVEFLLGPELVLRSEFVLSRFFHG